MNSFIAPASALTRRAFLRTSALAAVASRVAVAQVAAPAAGMARHLPARIVSAPDIPLPAGKREQGAVVSNRRSNNPRPASILW